MAYAEQAHRGPNYMTFKHFVSPGGAARRLSNAQSDPFGNRQQVIRHAERHYGHPGLPPEIQIAGKQ